MDIVGDSQFGDNNSSQRLSEVKDYNENNVNKEL